MVSTSSSHTAAAWRTYRARVSDAAIQLSIAEALATSKEDRQEATTAYSACESAAFAAFRSASRTHHANLHAWRA